MRPVVSSNGKRGPVRLVGRHVVGHHELAFAAHEAVDMHDRAAIGRGIIHRPLQRTFGIETREADAGERGRQTRDLVHDLARVRVIPVKPHRLRQQLGDLPVLKTVGGSITLRTGWMRRSALVKVPFFSRKRGARQEHVRVVGGLVEEQVVDDHAVHRGKACGDMRACPGSDWRMSSPWM